MTQDAHRYQREIDPRGEDSLSRVARRIPSGAVVLDLGSGSGALGRYLAAAKGCVVDGIDVEPSAKEVSAGYRHFLVADLETADLGALLGAARYDVVVCADVIEHLRAPERLLRQLAAVLAPGGRVLLSVPNVAYAGVIATLLAGDFPYAREGLLDDTHVRFFTRRTLFRLLRDIGLVPLDLERVVLDVRQSEFRDRFADAMTPALRDALVHRPEALTYQLIVQAAPSGPGLRALDDDGPEEMIPELAFSSRLYWRGATGGYAERDSATAIGVIGRSNQRLEHPIRAPGDAIAALRLDLADRPGYLRVHTICAFDAAGDCVWEWDGAVETLEAAPRAEVEFAPAAPPERGVVAVLSGTDPWIELPVPPEALARIGPSGSLACDVSWPESTDYLALSERLLQSDVSRRRNEELERAVADGEARLATATADTRRAGERLDVATAALVAQWNVLREEVAELSRRFVRSPAWRIGDRVGEFSLRVRRKPSAELARLLDEAAAALLAPSPSDARDVPAWLGEQRDALQNFHDRAIQLVDSKRHRIGRRVWRTARLLRLRFAPATPGDELAATLELASAQLNAARLAAEAAGPRRSGASVRANGVAAAPLAPHDASADVIVCVHNAPEDTRNCLHALVENTTPPYGIILVDDGSAEDTAAFLRDFAAKQGAILIRNESARGYTFAANQGLRASTAEWVVLLNSDTIVAPGWLDRMIACGESERTIGAVGPLSNCASWQSIPLQLGPDGDWAQNPLPEGMTVAEMGEWVARHSARARPKLPFLNGFCYAIRRAAIDAIGLFDEEHFGQGFHEENDYSLRLAKAGFTLAVADDAYVFHHQSRSYSNERRKALSDRSGQILGRLHTQALIERNLERLRSDLPLAGVRARQAVALAAWDARATARRRFESRRVAFVLPERLATSAATAILQQAERARLDLGVDARVFGLRTQRRAYERLYGDPERVEWSDDADVLAAGLERVDAAVLAGAALHAVVRNAPQDLPIVWQLGFGGREPREPVAGRSVVWTAATDRARRALADALGAAPTLVAPGIDTHLFAPRPRLDGVSRRDAVRVAAAVRDAQDAHEVESTLHLLEALSHRWGDRLEVLVLGSARSRRELAPYVDRPGWTVPGPLSRGELASLLGETDLFVDLSASGPGLFALEACASGAVAVVARGSGAAEAAAQVAADAKPGLVEARDHAAALEAVVRLAEGHEARAELARLGAEFAARHDAVTGVVRLLDLLFPGTL